MNFIKNLTVLAFLSFINKSFASQEIEVNCGPCKILKNCLTNNCISYTGAALGGAQECSTQTKCSTIKYPYFYFSQSCTKDTNGVICTNNCCVKLSTASSFPKTCSDSFMTPSKFCSSTQSSGSNSGAIAGAIVGTLAGLFILIVLGCFIYHECYIKKKMLEGAENQHQESIKKQAKQKCQPSIQNKKRNIKTYIKQTMKTQMSKVNQQRKKKGSIKSKKTRAEILQIYGRPPLKSSQSIDQNKIQNNADS